MGAYVLAVIAAVAFVVGGAGGVLASQRLRHADRPHDAFPWSRSGPVCDGVWLLKVSTHGAELGAYPTTVGRRIS